MQIEFAPSARSTVGLEWEVAIVDRNTGELASVADRVLEVLDERSEGGRHPTITSELLTNTVELVSGVHERVAGAVADLEGQLAEVRAVIDELGEYELVCSGSHPFSQWYDQQLTDKPRYHKLIERTRWWGRNMMIWGIHVHVGIEERDKALPDPRRTARLPPPPAGAVAPRARSGRASRPGTRRTARSCSSSCPRPGSPIRSPTGPRTSATSTTSCAPASSRTTPRCAGTSARRRAGAPSRCASATACRRRARSPRSARSCSASSTG